MTRNAGLGLCYMLAMALGAVAATPSAARAQEKPGSVQAAKKYSVIATIVSTDPAQRSVKLRFPGGDTHSFTVEKDVDLTKVKQGDKVNIEYVESVALSVQRPGEAKSEMKVEEARKRMPGGVDLGRTVSATAKITAVNAKEKTITVKGPDGETDTIDVGTPDAQEQVKNLKVGDEINVTYTQAVAVRLVPTKSGN